MSKRKYKTSGRRRPLNNVNEKNGGKNKGQTKRGVSFTPYYTSRNEIERYIKLETECYKENECGSYELADDEVYSYDLSYVKTNRPKKNYTN